MATKAVGKITENGSMVPLEADDEIVQVPMRLPKSLVDAVDARRAQVGEKSRNAWLERAIRWALAQPTRTEQRETRT